MPVLKPLQGYSEIILDRLRTTLEPQEYEGMKRLLLDDPQQYRFGEIPLTNALNKIRRFQGWMGLNRVVNEAIEDVFVAGIQRGIPMEQMASEFGLSLPEAQRTYNRAVVAASTGRFIGETRTLAPSSVGIRNLQRKVEVFHGQIQAQLDQISRRTGRKFFLKVDYKPDINGGHAIMQIIEHAKDDKGNLVSRNIGEPFLYTSWEGREMVGSARTKAWFTYNLDAWRNLPPRLGRRAAFLPPKRKATRPVTAQDVLSTLTTPVSELQKRGGKASIRVIPKWESTNNPFWTLSSSRPVYSRQTIPGMLPPSREEILRAVTTPVMSRRGQKGATAALHVRNPLHTQMATIVADLVQRYIKEEKDITDPSTAFSFTQGFTKLKTKMGTPYFVSVPKDYSLRYQNAGVAGAAWSLISSNAKETGPIPGYYMYKRGTYHPIRKIGANYGPIMTAAGVYDNVALGKLIKRAQLGSQPEEMLGVRDKETGQFQELPRVRASFLPQTWDRYKTAYRAKAAIFLDSHPALGEGFGLIDTRFAGVMARPFAQEPGTWDVPLPADVTEEEVRQMLFGDNPDKPYRIYKSGQPIRLWKRHEGLNIGNWHQAIVTGVEFIEDELGRRIARLQGHRESEPSGVLSIKLAGHKSFDARANLRRQFGLDVDLALSAPSHSLNFMVETLAFLPEEELLKYWQKANGPNSRPPARYAHSLLGARQVTTEDIEKELAPYIKTWQAYLKDRTRIVTTVSTLPESAYKVYKELGRVVGEGKEVGKTTGGETLYRAKIRSAVSIVDMPVTARMDPANESRSRLSMTEAMFLNQAFPNGVIDEIKKMSAPYRAPYLALAHVGLDIGTGQTHLENTMPIVNLSQVDNETFAKFMEAFKEEKERFAQTYLSDAELAEYEKTSKLLPQDTRNVLEIAYRRVFGDSLIQYGNRRRQYAFAPPHLVRGFAKGGGTERGKKMYEDTQIALVSAYLKRYEQYTGKKLSPDVWAYYTGNDEFVSKKAAPGVDRAALLINEAWREQKAFLAEPVFQRGLTRGLLDFRAKHIVSSSYGTAAELSPNEVARSRRAIWRMYDAFGDKEKQKAILAASRRGLLRSIDTRSPNVNPEEQLTQVLNIIDEAQLRKRGSSVRLGRSLIPLYSEFWPMSQKGDSDADISRSIPITHIIKGEIDETEKRAGYTYEQIEVDGEIWSIGNPADTTSVERILKAATYYNPSEEYESRLEKLSVGTLGKPPKTTKRGRITKKERRAYLQNALRKIVPDLGEIASSFIPYEDISHTQYENELFAQEQMGMTFNAYVMLMRGLAKPELRGLVAKFGEHQYQNPLDKKPWPIGSPEANFLYSISRLKIGGDDGDATWEAAQQRILSMLPELAYDDPVRARWLAAMVSPGKTSERKLGLIAGRILRGDIGKLRKTLDRLAGGHWLGSDAALARMMTAIGTQNFLYRFGVQTGEAGYGYQPDPHRQTPTGKTIPEEVLQAFSPYMENYRQAVKIMALGLKRGQRWFVGWPTIIKRMDELNLFPHPPAAKEGDITRVTAEQAKQKRDKDEFRVIVAGSRTFQNYDLLAKKLDAILSKRTESGQKIVIVSGGARGADTLGERYAQERGYEVKRFPADWEKYGRRAGYIRNKVMAQHADALVAFWDRRSPGTKNMIALAKQMGLATRVIYTTYGAKETQDVPDLKAEETSPQQDTPWWEEMDRAIRQAFETKTPFVRGLRRRVFGSPGDNGEIPLGASPGNIQLDPHLLMARAIERASHIPEFGMTPIPENAQALVGSLVESATKLAVHEQATQTMEEITSMRRSIPDEQISGKEDYPYQPIVEALYEFAEARYRKTDGNKYYVQRGSIPFAVLRRGAKWEVSGLDIARIHTSPPTETFKARYQQQDDVYRLLAANALRQGKLSLFSLRNKTIGMDREGNPILRTEKPDLPLNKIGVAHIFPSKEVSPVLQSMYREAKELLQYVKPQRETYFSEKYHDQAVSFYSPAHSFVLELQRLENEGYDLSTPPDEILKMLRPGADPQKAIQHAKLLASLAREAGQHYSKRLQDVLIGKQTDETTLYDLPRRSSKSILQSALENIQYTKRATQYVWNMLPTALVEWEKAIRDRFGGKVPVDFRKTVELAKEVYDRLPRFARGGKTSGPRLALVGDNPSGQEYIVPSEKIIRLRGGLMAFDPTSLGNTQAGGVAVAQSGMTPNIPDDEYMSPPLQSQYPAPGTEEDEVIATGEEAMRLFEEAMSGKFSTTQAISNEEASRAFSQIAFESPKRRQAAKASIQGISGIPDITSAPPPPPPSAKQPSRSTPSSAQGGQRARRRPSKPGPPPGQPGYSGQPPGGGGQPPITPAGGGPAGPQGQQPGGSGNAPATTISSIMKEVTVYSAPMRQEQVGKFRAMMRELRKPENADLVEGILKGKIVLPRSHPLYKALHFANQFSPLATATRAMNIGYRTKLERYTLEAKQDKDFGKKITQAIQEATTRLASASSPQEIGRWRATLKILKEIQQNRGLPQAEAMLLQSTNRPSQEEIIAASDFERSLAEEARAAGPQGEAWAKRYIEEGVPESEIPAGVRDVYRRVGDIASQHGLDYIRFLMEDKLSRRRRSQAVKMASSSVARSSLSMEQIGLRSAQAAAQIIAEKEVRDTSLSPFERLQRHKNVLREANEAALGALDALGQSPSSRNLGRSIKDLQSNIETLNTTFERWNKEAVPLVGLLGRHRDQLEKMYQVQKTITETTTKQIKTMEKGLRYAEREAEEMRVLGGTPEERKTAASRLLYYRNQLRRLQKIQEESVAREEVIGQRLQRAYQIRGKEGQYGETLGGLTGRGGPLDPQRLFYTLSNLMHVNWYGIQPLMRAREAYAASMLAQGSMAYQTTGRTTDEAMRYLSNRAAWEEIQAAAGKGADRTLSVFHPLLQAMRKGGPLEGVPVAAGSIGMTGSLLLGGGILASQGKRVIGGIGRVIGLPLTRIAGGEAPLGFWGAMGSAATSIGGVLSGLGGALAGWQVYSATHPSEARAVGQYAALGWDWIKSKTREATATDLYAPPEEKAAARQKIREEYEATRSRRALVALYGEEQANVILGAQDVNRQLAAQGPQVKSFMDALRKASTFTGYGAVAGEVELANLGAMATNFLGPDVLGRQDVQAIFTDIVRKASQIPSVSSVDLANRMMQGAMASGYLPRTEGFYRALSAMASTDGSLAETEAMRVALQQVAPGLMWAGMDEYIAPVARKFKALNATDPFQARKLMGRITGYDVTTLQRSPYFIADIARRAGLNWLASISDKDRPWQTAYEAQFREFSNQQRRYELSTQLGARWRFTGFNQVSGVAEMQLAGFSGGRAEQEIRWQEQRLALEKEYWTYRREQEQISFQFGQRAHQIQMRQMRLRLKELRHALDTEFGDEKSKTQRYNELAKQLFILRSGFQREDFAIQGQRMAITQQWKREDLQRAAERLDTQYAWQTQDFAFNREGFELQAGWQAEDFQRAIRYASGRQRLDLMRQYERQLILNERKRQAMRRQEGHAQVRYSWQKDDLERERQRFEITAGWKQEDLQRAKQRFEEIYALQIQMYDLQTEQDEEARKFQKEVLEERIRILEDQIALSQEKNAADIEAYNKKRELDAAQRAFDEEVQNQKLGWQKQDLEHQRLLATSQEQIRKKQEEINDAIKVMNALYVMGPELLAEYLPPIKAYQDEIERTIQLLEKMDEANMMRLGKIKDVDVVPPVPAGLGHGPPRPKAAGGPVRQPTLALLGEYGQEEYVVPQGGALVLRSPGSEETVQVLLQILGVLSQIARNTTGGNNLSPAVLEGAIRAGVAALFDESYH